MNPLLAGKVAVIFGGGGAIGGACARTFAREGARVFLAGRTLEKLQRVARDIEASGGQAAASVVDVSDPRAVEACVADIISRGGRIDVMLNAISVAHVQGKSLLDTTLEEFEQPIAAAARTQFIPARAVARQMAKQQGGVIITLTTPGGRLAGKGFLANGVFSAATEAFARLAAAELGGYGIRVVTLRPDALPDAVELSGAREVFEGVSRIVGIPVHEMLAERGRKSTLLGRLPRLQEVAEFAAFAASDRAGAMTGAIANLTCGSLTD